MTGSVDWEQFLRDCSAHGILPLVRSSFHRIEWKGVPSAVADRIVSLSQRGRMKSFLLAAENVRLVGLLKSRGIEAVSFKGPLLAEHVYGSLDLRQSLDIDLLVLPEDSVRTRTILIEEGFAEIAQGDQREYFVQLGQQALRNRKTGITVDLHWKLAPFGIPFPFPQAELWDRPQALPLLGAVLPTFSWEHLALFLAFHGTKERWRQLKWVADFSLLYTARPELDWDSLRERAAQRHCARMLILAASLCHALELPAPPSLIEAGAGDPRVSGLVESALRRLMHPAPESDWDVFRHEIAATERLRDQAAHVAALLTTPTASDFAAVRLPEHLRGLYYAIRPFRLVAKGVRLAAERYWARAAR